MATEQALPQHTARQELVSVAIEYVALRHPRVVSRQVLRWLIELLLQQYAHKTVERQTLAEPSDAGLIYTVRREMKTLLVDRVLLPPWRRSTSPVPLRAGPRGSSSAVEHVASATPQGAGSIPAFSTGRASGLTI